MENSLTNQEDQNEGSVNFRIRRIKDGKHEAKGHHDLHKQIIQHHKDKRHLCGKLADQYTLKYLRLIKDTVEKHIWINETQLLEKAQDEGLPTDFTYDGLRIYPIWKSANAIKVDYVLVFTKLIDPNNTDGPHKDQENYVFWLDVKISQDRWCQLDHEHKSLVVNHRLCQPSCPDGEQPMLA